MVSKLVKRFIYMVEFMNLSSGNLALGKGHTVKLYKSLQHFYVTLVTQVIC